MSLLGFGLSMSTSIEPARRTQPMASTAKPVNSVTVYVGRDAGFGRCFAFCFGFCCFSALLAKKTTITVIRIRFPFGFVCEQTKAEATNCNWLQLVSETWISCVVWGRWGGLGRLSVAPMDFASSLFAFLLHTIFGSSIEFVSYAGSTPCVEEL